MDKKSVKRGISTRKEVYDFLVNYFKENGYAPSMREICNGTGLKSTSSVNSQLQVLERMGKIEMKHNFPRAIRIVGYEFIKVEGGSNNA